jgi:hypothetical protein
MELRKRSHPESFAGVKKKITRKKKGKRKQKRSLTRWTEEEHIKLFRLYKRLRTI